MTLLEQFNDGHSWWNEYEEKWRFADERTEEQQYESACRGASCFDCIRCEMADGYPIGFCREVDDFRYGDNIPYKDGLDCFEPRAVCR